MNLKSYLQNKFLYFFDMLAKLCGASMIGLNSVLSESN
jgi:hypothetical protein